MLRTADTKRLAADLPGYVPLHAFSAALPFYECEIEVRLMVRHELSALQQYSLACVSKGVDSVDAIDVVLGAGRPAITAALASLLGVELVSPRNLGVGPSHFVLTERGVDALSELGWRKPETSVVRVLYDGLSGEFVAPNRLLYINSGESAKLGLHVVPARCQAPALGDVEVSAMRRILRELRRHDPRRVPDGELHDLIGIGARRPVYRRCDVAAFQGSDGALVFRVLDRGKRLHAYEDALTAMFPKQPEVLPFERSDTAALPVELSPLLSRELLQKADELEDERERLQTIINTEEQTAVEVLASGRDDTPAVAPAVAPAPSRTRAELEALKQRLAEVERERDSLRHVETYEHRELLEKALKHARKRVIIVSPWLEPAAINDELQNLMRRALERGVEIVIGWGMPPNSEEKGAKRDERSLYMLRQLERLARDTKEAAERLKKEQAARRAKLAERGHTVTEAPPNDERQMGRLRVVRLGDTHEKILISDQHFAVVTSFNFLSFRADPKRGFRRETGMYHQIKPEIERLIDDVMGRIERVERSALPGDRDTLVAV